MDDNKSDEGAVIALNLSDEDLLTLISKPLAEAQTYWNNKLKAVREDNMSLWLPNQWEGTEVYDYQTNYLYQDNRIFPAVETVVSVVNARIPQPDVMPGQDSIISMQIAKDVGKIIEAFVKKYGVDEVFRLNVRNLLLKRIGYVKLRFDKSIGRDGEIVVENVMPEDVIVDMDAKMGDTPRFIAHRIKNHTGEELIAMFPDSRQKIYEMLQVNRRDSKGELVAYKSQLARKRDLWEVWFRYYDEETGKYMGGLAVMDEFFKLVIHKDRNPNWNYEDDKTATGNFLDSPEPPIIPINYLNDGSSYIDLVSLVEQAAGLQKALNYRGLQIMENADQASSGIVFNTNMISKEEVAMLVGSPDEKIGVQGNVNEAMSRIPTPQLANYVIEDKLDIRNELDNIMGTHETTRGEASPNRTLGQDQLQRESDYGRMDEIARAVERQGSKVYRYLLQMMKVFYTEDHYFKAVGEDGQFDFLTMNSDMIEDGLDITVAAGSVKPINRASQQKWVGDLVSAGMIDPLTVYEVAAGGNLPSPKKMLERFILYQNDPKAFMETAKEDEFNRQAFMDVQILNRGEVPKARDEYTPAYFKFMNGYMMSGEFDNLPPLVKQLYIEYLRTAQEQAGRQLQAMMTQMPTQEELDMAAQQEATSMQASNQMQPPMPAEESPNPAAKQKTPVA
jgi:hypothetical protein